MLIFGDYACLPTQDIVPVFGKRGFRVFNFSSYYMGCPQITNLLPKGIDCSTDENLDMSYFDYIYGDEYTFMDFMYVVTELYNGSVVYLLINHSELFDRLAESLAEIIKQRFGYLSYFVNDIDDYETIVNELDSCSFSAPGLVNFDNDRLRYLSILHAKGLFQDDPENYD